MGIKSDKCEKEGLPDYPFIGIADNGLVVLFEKLRSGTVLHPGKSPWKIGNSDYTWDMDCFNPYSGSITLSNE